MAEISTASQEQARGIEHINPTMGQMDKVTQANAPGAQQSASAAAELASQARQLAGGIGRLRSLVTGGK